jgi:hypothetical protein
VDGDSLTSFPSQLLREGKLNGVPLLIGTNTDEGTGFSPPGPNTQQGLFNDFPSWRSYTLSPTTIRPLLRLYPDDPCSEPPLSIGNCSVFPSEGLVWRRDAAIGGDMVMDSGRRRMCETWEDSLKTSYSYLIYTRLWNKTALAGV